MHPLAMVTAHKSKHIKSWYPGPLPVLYCLLLLFAVLGNHCHGNPDAKRLFDDLLQKRRYNKLVRPVSNYSLPVEVTFGLSFAQLIDVDEKNEIMTTMMWLMQEWTDHNLKWEPEEYGGIQEFFVPSSLIWLPDIVLYNNADGDYTVTIMTKASLNYTGRVSWGPPAIFKSQCDIDVEYFPFDQQTCALKFLPWSHDGFKVDMGHIWNDLYNGTAGIDVGIDMSHFVPSQEWDILAVPARKNIVRYPCCSEPYPDITFNITLRRKRLFYSINIIAPCICINLLTLTGFYVPCDCGEKISICITILLSLSMFQLLLFDLLPGTSLTIPLLGKYILFTLFIISGSVLCSVISLNVNYRGNKVGQMPVVTRWLFLDVLARVMCMRQPTSEEQDKEMEHQIDWSLGRSNLSDYIKPYKRRFQQRKTLIAAAIQRYTAETLDDNYIQRYTAETLDDNYPGFSISPSFLGMSDPESQSFQEAGVNHQQTSVQKAMQGVSYIAMHHHSEEAAKRIKADWVYMARVVDRFLLWIYITLSFLCTMVLLLNAPALYDKRPPLTSHTHM